MSGGGPSEIIGSMAVEFTTEGKEGVFAALEDIGKKAAGVGAIIASVGSPLAGVAAGVAVAGALAVQKVVSAAADTMKDFAVNLWNLAKAGLANSKEGERLAVTWERVSRIVGGAFAPLWDKLADTFEGMVPHIESAAKAVGDLLGQVIDALTPTFRAAADAAKGFLATLERVAEFFSAKMERSGFAKGGGYRELTPRGAGGFEGVTDVYKRVSAAALRSAPGGASKEPVEQIRDYFQEFMSFTWIETLVSKMVDALRTLAKAFNPFSK